MIQVQTYEVEEIHGELGNMAADAEAQELIEKLGLTGQQSLIHADTCTRFPYRLMTKAEFKVFSLLFPHRVSLTDYKDSIIPIRVLQVAAFVKDFAGAPCRYIKVWHCGSAKEDPLLVGHTSEYGGEFYLLARWGDGLLSMESLGRKAKDLWIVKAKTKLLAEIQKCQSDLGSLDSIAEEVIATGEPDSAQMRYELGQVQ